MLLPQTLRGAQLGLPQSRAVILRRTQLRTHHLHTRSRFQSPQNPSFDFQSSSSNTTCYLSIVALSSSLRKRQLLPAMTPLNQNRLHAGHSHSHHHDNSYLTSTNKKDAGVRITRIGLYVNLIMALAKGAGGYFFHSQALVADAFHSLTDLVSDFMTLGTVSWSLKPPTDRFPSGYGKVESLGSLGVSGLLVAGGVLMGLNACEVLFHEFFAEAAASGGHSHGMFGHSHSHNSTDLGPNINAAWLAAGSIVVKEYLYRASEFDHGTSPRLKLIFVAIAMKIAQERKSSVLASNAVHHRIDSLTSIVALVAIGGSHLFNGASWLDPVGGLIVSMMVIKAGWGNTRTALFELADVGIDEEMKDSVRKAATKSLSTGSFREAGIEGTDIQVRDIQGVKAGQNYLVDIALSVPSIYTMKQTRLIEDVVRERVGSHVRGVRRVKTRFMPIEDKETDFADEFIGADISPRSSPEPEDEKESRHDHDHDHKHNHPYTNGDAKKRR